MFRQSLWQASSEDRSQSSKFPLKDLWIQYPTRCCCYVWSSHLQPIATLQVSDLHNVLSSTALLSLCKLKSLAFFKESIYFIFGPPLFLLPSAFSGIIVFSRESCLLMICPKQDRLRFIILASRDRSGLICVRTHSFVFPSAFFTALPSRRCQRPYRKRATVGFLWAVWGWGVGKACLTNDPIVAMTESSF